MRDYYQMTIDSVPLNGQIKVTGVSELFLDPDVCAVEITIHSTKLNRSAAESSVRKRADYARQEMKNMLSKNTQISEVFENQAVENGFLALWKFVIIREDITRISQLAAHLRTKLPNYVEFGSYEFFVSPEKLSKARRMAIQQAVNDAKNKAETIAAAFGQHIRGLLSVVETETSVHATQQQSVLKTAATTPRPATMSVTDGTSDLWGTAHRAAQRCICVKLDAVCALGNFVL